ncbi:MAG: hypothetical protein AB7P37_19815 [Ramlibacter sp.]
MKKLTPLATPPSAHERYLEIRTAKHHIVRNVLIANHAHIEAQFDVLDAAVKAGTLEDVDACSDCKKISDELRACYSSKTQALTKLKKKILQAQPKRQLKYCPMCGVTRHSTFDHYLPAAEYPEFSVHAENLVPCCALCNSTKDDYWKDGHGQRYFLHAYTDEIPDAQFLFVDLQEAEDGDAVGANFRLEKPGEVNAETWRLITSHFKRLKLLAQYDNLGGEEIAEVLGDCRDYSDEGGARPRNFLRRMTTRARQVFGRNHWRVVLMSELADHANFHDWLKAFD